MRESAKTAGVSALLRTWCPIREFSITHWCWRFCWENGVRSEYPKRAAGFGTQKDIRTPADIISPVGSVGHFSLYPCLPLMCYGDQPYWLYCQVYPSIYGVFITIFPLWIWIRRLFKTRFGRPCCGKYKLSVREASGHDAIDTTRNAREYASYSEAQVDVYYSIVIIMGHSVRQALDWANVVQHFISHLSYVLRSD